MTSPVAIELLYFDGCPNHEPVVARLPQLLEQAGVAAEVGLKRVESDEDAQKVGFLGSPTVRIHGRDVEPGADTREDFGLKCRLYRTPDGLRGEPLDEWILAALAGAPPARSDRASRVDALLGGRSAQRRLTDAPPAARALHRAVMRSFLAGSAPKAADLDRLADELGVDEDAALEELERRDLVWRDASGDVTAAYPFSGGPTAHRVRLERSGTEVFAMCAIDALGIPFLAREAGEVLSEDTTDGAPVRVRVAPGGVTEADPADVVVIVGRTGDGPSASACCPHLTFVRDRSGAEEILAATPRLRGDVVDLDEAVALGREIFEGLIDASAG